MTKSIQEYHEEFLYPVVRVRSDKAAGSGTIIYSEQDPENEGEYISLVLTNHHVIADLITYKKDWDSLLKKKVEKEFVNPATVEVFAYTRQSSVDSTNSFRAEVVAYDAQHDLAVLRVESAKRFKHAAALIPRDQIKKLRLYMDVCVTGCSMAHEPFSNFGQLTFLSEIIDQKKYLMVNAGSYFGNSGGALFLKETGELIGVPSRISALQIGFGVDIIAFMGFSAHPERIYEFFEEQELKFIYDDEDTYAAALKRRENRKREALLALKAEAADESRSGGESLSD